MNDNGLQTVKPANVYQPTPHEKALFQALVTAEDALTIEKLCENAGVSKPTYYKMRNDPDRWAWWCEQVNGFVKGESSRVYDKMTREAIRGDVADRKLWLERFDPEYVPRSKNDSETRFVVSAIPAYERQALEAEGVLKPPTGWDEWRSGKGLPAPVLDQDGREMAAEEVQEREAAKQALRDEMRAPGTGEAVEWARDPETGSMVRRVIAAESTPEGGLSADGQADMP